MAPTTFVSRDIPLRGGRNIRDLGGYRSRFGGTVRWGRVIRSGRLDGLHGDDVATLRALDLAAVYDLRTSEEREAAPDTIPSVHVPLLAEERLVDLGLGDLDDRESGTRFLVDLNRRMLERAGPEIGAILFTLVDRADGSMLFHCTAGKDRTGLLAALVLDLLGVDRGDILDDYEWSGHQSRPADVRATLRRLTDHGVPIEAVAGLLAAPRSVMAAVLRTLDEEYGGVESYLAEHGGVDRGAVSAMRAALLE